MKQQAGWVGFGGHVGVPASQQQARGHGAQCGYRAWEQGQEKHPRHLHMRVFSFFGEISIGASPIHTYVCVCVSHCCARVSSKGEIAVNVTAAVNGWAVFRIE